MSEKAIDLVIVEPSTDDEAWAFYSPQIPGLVGGRDSVLQLREDLPAILRFAGVTLPARLRTPLEQTYDATGLAYIIRTAQDEHSKARLAAAQRLRAALLVPDQRDDLLSSPRTRTVEILFIAAVASDTVEDIANQLHPSGDAAVVVCSVAEEFIWSFHFTNAEDLDEAARPLDELGLSMETTIGEVMRKRPTGQAVPALLASP